MSSLSENSLPSSLAFDKTLPIPLRTSLPRANPIFLTLPTWLDKALDKAEDAKGVGQQKKSKKKKVMQDGPKTQVHGIKAPGNWQPHQFRKK